MAGRFEENGSHCTTLRRRRNAATRLTFAQPGGFEYRPEHGPPPQYLEPHAVSPRAPFVLGPFFET
eukprot:3633482-Pleurochrysis_carterae.AAC.1